MKHRLFGGYNATPKQIKIPIHNSSVNYTYKKNSNVINTNHFDQKKI